MEQVPLAGLPTAHPLLAALVVPSPSVAVGLAVWHTPNSAGAQECTGHLGQTPQTSYDVSCFPLRRLWRRYLRTHGS